MNSLNLDGDVSIVLCGEAGQGIQTVENILVKSIKTGGYNVFSTKEYMSRVRGGQNSTQIRVSSNKVRAYVDRIDILVALSERAVEHLKDRISDDTWIICDQNLLHDLDDYYNIIRVPFLDKASELGGPIFSNVIAAGALSCILGIDKDDFDECITAMFESKGEKILSGDLKAGREGYSLGQTLINSGEISVNVNKNSHLKNDILINGTEAVGLGCISGGCRFMSSYPMTPSSPLQVFIASNAHEFDMVFEQAEDEIAAINMALGASYAGARSIVATSGSGFALMVEGVGLAGMIETPIVIYLAQRPGPAVGLPTRTAQEDLDLALYGSPGEFPRIILAPGNFQDALELSHHAFNLADKYQIPVFILSDQYFADIYYNIENLDLDGLEVDNHIIETPSDYNRYELTPDGISPRGIPGYGNGLVLADSDEHDAEGHISEDLNVRTLMVQKRLKKMDKIKEDAFAPELISASKSDNFKLMVVGWGSTYGPIKEALEELNREDIAFLHFKQIYPLTKNTPNLLAMAEKTIILENNAKGQFANLIKLETGFEIHDKFLKYNGMPYSVEEVVKILKDNLGGI
ncbi:2-oxoacid:acceptor oxidoreductase subunit alpha [Methanobacterium alcaliphilum]|uniref:2-oxoacid:acceptor oxidoreductase subunit alpha n=1 Tax=Methanobacterium alcaliphilum TaxID=392018 RepID=UPI00200AA6BE|nr:2-oxoacid:acceptor oxidoreductase subunit alpha [Methanobacterium alcaliphilum]MCK9151696.1 2-oxoacid:acceptor oxidoreductase subunit alpha [Methanobacterium alcaliphilum]